MNEDRKLDDEPLIPSRACLSPQQIRSGMFRLQKRVDELRRYDADPDFWQFRRVKKLSDELIKLRESIDNTLKDIFGEHTIEYKRFSAAVKGESSHIANFMLAMHYALGRTNPARDFRDQKLKAVLEAIEFLSEELESRGFSEAGASVPLVEEKEVDDAHLSRLRQVFVVHGHDESAREAVARFLEQIGFEAIILHEQANQGRTIIEKVVDHGDVGFAVVLLTPDDEGCEKGGVAMLRARQNVILELGYFIGRLGRKRVCALKRGDVEVPSDFGGVVYEKFDEGRGWKLILGRELQEAGFEIDWNKVMRR